MSPRSSCIPVPQSVGPSIRPLQAESDRSVDFLMPFIPQVIRIVKLIRGILRKGVRPCLVGGLSAFVMLNEVKHLANERNQCLLPRLAQILRCRSG